MSAFSLYIIRYLTGSLLAISGAREGPWGQYFDISVTQTGSAAQPVVAMPIARGFVYHMISPKVFVVHANEWVARYDIKVGHHRVMRPFVEEFAEMWPANLRAASLMPLGDLDIFQQ